jgi:hypothetical protein
VTAFREAVSHVEAARAEVQARLRDAATAEQAAGQQRMLACRLADLAKPLTPGWLGARLDVSAADLPLGVDAAAQAAVMIRLGEAFPVPDASFPVVVPLLGVGHLTIDTDARHEQVAGWLRSILLRLTAAFPDGVLRVLPVDGATLGAAFAAFRPLIDSGVWGRPATDADSFRALLGQAEDQVADAQAGQRDLPFLLVACAALPVGVGPAEYARLAALAHAGPAARVHLLVCGWPPTQTYGGQPAVLDNTTQLTGQGNGFHVSEPAGRHRFDHAGTGLPALVALDRPPAPELIAFVCANLARTARTLAAVDFAALMPQEIWRESSAEGLRTAVGREGRQWCELALDDVTPHWLVGGRTGSGKTVFQLNVLYGLMSRYSPDELSVYLLDFKEGISFSEFVPTAHDPTWIPHAATVGIESDREYGLAVLRALSREMNRRAGEFKRAGVTRLADLRARKADIAMPRVLTVIDEFQVLLAGNDTIAAEAVALLEEVARKGRSYGIHLVLASQTLSGIEALWTKSESIFGQFPLRVALSGGGGILDTLNDAADNLDVGTVIVNTAAGAAEGNRLVKFPNAPQPALAAQRQLLWEARPPGDQPPAVFAGYAEHHVDDDPTITRLTGNVTRRTAYVGRAIDIGLPAAGFVLDPTPGRHLAVLGTSPTGADILHAVAISLARQHQPATATFYLAPLVAAADLAANDTAADLIDAGHECKLVGIDELADTYRTIVDSTGTDATARRAAAAKPRYVIVWGADAASTLLTTYSPDGRCGQQDLRAILRHGPAYGVHLLGWWRTLARFNDDTGGTAGREDIACLVATNLTAQDVQSLTGDYQLSWHPRHNRALLIDRHDDRRALIVPYLRAGHDHQDAR